MHNCIAFTSVYSIKAYHNKKLGELGQNCGWGLQPIAPWLAPPPRATCDHTRRHCVHESNKTAAKQKFTRHQRVTGGPGRHFSVSTT